MQSVEEVFRCPGCGGPWARDGACAACGRRVGTSGGIYDVIGDAQVDGALSRVERFYTANPFPGYAPEDDATVILDRARRTPFLNVLNDSIDPVATVLDCGCGTAQVAAFLALASSGRTVVGVDGCLASLKAADAFRSRAHVANLLLMRANLFALPLKPAAFDVVISRGVVHHTERPYEAITRIASYVAEDGLLILGFYENVARCFHRIRRGAARIVGRPISFLDPVLRRNDLTDDKKRIWIEDQYRHPLERILPLPRVLASIGAGGLEWVRSVPPLDPQATLRDPSPEPRGLLGALLRMGWLLASFSDEDAGLVCVVARRQRRS